MMSLYPHTHTHTPPTNTTLERGSYSILVTGHAGENYWNSAPESRALGCFDCLRDIVLNHPFGGFHEEHLGHGTHLCTLCHPCTEPEFSEKRALFQREHFFSNVEFSKICVKTTLILTKIKSNRIMQRTETQEVLSILFGQAKLHFCLGLAIIIMSWECDKK